MFDGYVICGTPRTGSTLLCGLLASAGAGNPHSFYRREDIAEWAREWGMPLEGGTDGLDFQTAYLAAAIRAGKGSTAIFGLRLMKENLGDLSAILDGIHPGLPSERARLEVAFGRLLYIHLSRADKLAQAVSFIKAKQTGLWHVAPDGTEIERVAPPQEPRYDFALIRRQVAEFQDFDDDWNAWFAEQGISPLRVGYESLSADPAAKLGEICATLGVRAPEQQAVRPGVAKLADETSLDWVRRYRLQAGS